MLVLVTGHLYTVYTYTVHTYTFPALVQTLFTPQLSIERYTPKLYHLVTAARRAFMMLEQRLGGIVSEQLMVHRSPFFLHESREGEKNPSQRETREDL